MQTPPAEEYSRSVLANMVIESVHSIQKWIALVADEADGLKGNAALE
jgi:hypothetical protein